MIHTTRRRCPCGAVLLTGLVITGLGTSAGAQTRHELSVGDVTVSVAPRRFGMRILCDGIEVIKHSEIVVTRPPWAPHYYWGPSTTAIAEATHTHADGAEVLRIVHRGEHDSFEGLETITVYPDGRVAQLFEGRLLQADADALFQWRIGALNATILIGRPYEAVLRDGRTVRGTVPVNPLEGSTDERTLAGDFATLAFDSRIGPIRIEVRAAPHVLVYDFRRDHWADPDDPYFWFGDLGSRSKTGETVRYDIVYHLPTAQPGPSADRVVPAAATIAPRPDAQIYPNDGPPTIIPRPKQATYSNEGCAVAQLRAIDVQHPAARIVAGQLAEYLAQTCGRRVELNLSPQPTPNAAVRFTGIAAEEWPAGKYTLSVSAAGIEIAAADADGFRYAVETLKQLVTRTPAGDVLVRGAQIVDWPTLRFRGVHLFTGGAGPELHLQLIRDVLAALKMNRLVLESEYIEWDSHPEIHHPKYGMPKDEVRQILGACARAGIEVIPLVMSLGHCQWIFETGHHLDLAEDPDAKWAYCVTNPKTYDFIFEIYAEALELFKPTVFHIGHDEYADRGRVPFRESSRPYSVEELFATDTRRLHAWLTERGVRPMMWGDMLLAKGEGPDACHARSKESAAALRAEIPTDILIADWHYCGNPPQDFVNLNVLHAAGFETVAATWDRPANIVHFAQAAHAQGSLGLLQTTWAGYSLDPDSFARHMPQYAAYVLAAETAWNADHPPDPETYPAQSYFLDLIGRSALRPANCGGWVADLAAAYNTPLAAGDPTGWFALGPEHDLSRVPAGEVRLKGLAFRLGTPADANRPATIVLRSKLTQDATLPNEVELLLNARAARLAILHATNFACDTGARVGQYTLTYADDTTTTLDVVYGQNILAYGDRAALAAAPIVWHGHTPAGQPVLLRALLWDNPRPSETIRSLGLRSAHAAGALLVLGVTGLEGNVTTHPGSAPAPRRSGEP